MHENVRYEKIYYVEIEEKRDNSVLGFRAGEPRIGVYIRFAKEFSRYY